MDYFSILSVAQPDIKAAIRDFEYNTGLLKKEKETEKAKKAKTDTHTENKNAGKKGGNGRTTIGPRGKRRNGRNRRPRRKK